MHNTALVLLFTLLGMGAACTSLAQPDSGFAFYADLPACGTGGVECQLIDGSCRLTRILRNMGFSCRFYHCALSAPNLTRVGVDSNSYWNALGRVTSLNFPSLTTITGSLSFGTGGSLSNVHLPALTSIHRLTLEDVDSLTSLELPSLTTVGNTLAVEKNALLERISFPNLVNVEGSLYIENNAVLRNVYVPRMSRCGRPSTSGSPTVFRTNAALLRLDMPALTNSFGMLVTGVETLVVPQLANVGASDLVLLPTMELYVCQATLMVRGALCTASNPDCRLCQATPGGPHTCALICGTPVPTLAPTLSPTEAPTTATPTTLGPTDAPTSSPTPAPSVSPSLAPSGAPSSSPTSAPSNSPTTQPSAGPTARPSASPSAHPSVSPSSAPSVSPSHSPSAAPSTSPTAAPSVAPSVAPTGGLSSAPSSAPTTSPTPHAEVCEGGLLSGGVCECGNSARCVCHHVSSCQCDNAEVCLCETGTAQCNGLDATKVRANLGVPLNCGNSRDCCAGEELDPCPNLSSQAPALHVTLATALLALLAALVAH